VLVSPRCALIIVRTRLARRVRVQRLVCRLSGPLVGLLTLERVRMCLRRCWSLCGY
jgi:hypothetical protein